MARVLADASFPDLLAQLKAKCGAWRGEVLFSWEGCSSTLCLSWFGGGEREGGRGNLWNLPEQGQVKRAGTWHWDAFMSNSS